MAEDNTAWHFIDFEFPEPAISKIQQVQDQFEVVFMAMAAPEGAALFETRISNDCIRLSFSPLAAKIFSGPLKHHGATKAAPPCIDGATLLVGHADALKMLSA